MIAHVYKVFARESCARMPRALVYHSIHDDHMKNVSRWSVSYSDFVGHLDYIESMGWETVTISSLDNSDDGKSRAFDEEIEYDKSRVAITFDDGYVNNWKAFEELQKRSMKATWFVVTDSIGKLSSWDTGSDKPFEMMDSAQLAELVTSGMEVGSHTRTHANLMSISDNEVLSEIRDSKKKLEDIVSGEVSGFAYPYGEYDYTLAEKVKGAGYTAACTTRPGWIYSNRDQFEMRRMTICSHDDVRAFALKMAFADNEIGWGKIGKYIIGRVKERFRIKGSVS